MLKINWMSQEKVTEVVRVIVGSCSEPGLWKKATDKLTWEEGVSVPPEQQEFYRAAVKGCQVGLCVTKKEIGMVTGVVGNIHLFLETEDENHYLLCSAGARSHLFKELSALWRAVSDTGEATREASLYVKDYSECPEGWIYETIFHVEGSPLRGTSTGNRKEVSQEDAYEEYLLERGRKILYGE